MSANMSSQHAELAMQAARRVARARRPAQKAKMGHVVCHHLLRMLNDESSSPEAGARVDRLRSQRARTATRLEDKQFSLGF